MSVSCVCLRRKQLYLVHTLAQTLKKLENMKKLPGVVSEHVGLLQWQLTGSQLLSCFNPNEKWKF